MSGETCKKCGSGLHNESECVNGLCEEMGRLRADNARLKGEVEAWREKYQEEYRIVDRVWKALGITSYYHAQPNAIWEHVSKLNSTLATYKAAVEKAKVALDECDCWCGVSESDGDRKLCARCQALHTLSALTGDATGIGETRERANPDAKIDRFHVEPPPQ